MTALRVLVVGCGAMGRMHAQALCRAAADVSCTDVVADAARLCAADTGATAVRDVRAAVERGIDAAVVTTPTATHTAVLTTLVRAGIPAFCEKPLALSLEDSQVVGELADRHGVPLQIGFHRRHDPDYRRARSAVADGAVGRVHIVHARTHTAGRPVDPVLGGSVLRDLQIHDFDAVRFVTGREAEAVTTFAVDPAGAGAAWNSPAVVSVLELSDGSTAVVTGGRPSPPGYDARLEVYGSEGSVAAGLDARTPMTGAQPRYERFTDRFAEAYTAEMDAFLALARGGENPCTWRDAYAAMQLAIAAERSAMAGGARVDVGSVA
jgi:myo-inositol 2-dehydrogenase/D-chiro-inositol 1-dehydrogenase